MSGPIDALCVRHGVARSYLDMAGRPALVPESTKRAVLSALGIDPNQAVTQTVPPPAGDESAEHLPSRSPARCCVPPFLRGGRIWGIALQLYQLRSDRGLGIGDFRDLADAVRVAAAAGADFVGLNPLHALNLAEPERCSPFSPSNRRFLNPLYIAVDAAPGYEPGDVSGTVGARLRAADFVDYGLVAETKTMALRAAWRRWRSREPGEGRGRRAFDAFRASRGEGLVRHATFEALSEHFAAQALPVGWPSWPRTFHDADGAAVRRFAGENPDVIEFHAWLQWVASGQLEEAARTARDSGMRIGLYLDLAVGEAPDGSATWADPDLILQGLKVGAPADLFNSKGQDWGLAPISPVALARRNHRPLHSLLRDVIRPAGALRLDHVMGLLRLYCIPQGMSAIDGTYLKYDIAMALEAVAEASHEASAVVIGEDLGNVPAGFRQLMRSAGIHSYRLLYFERKRGRLASPASYPVAALACLSTHDLPPLAGWWQGRDIDLRLEVGQIDGAAASNERRQRMLDLRSLTSRMAAAGRLERVAGLGDRPSLDDAIAAALHGHLASCPSRLLAVRLEDLAGEINPVNVPGTVDEYPNWRRRLSKSIDELAMTPRFQAIVAAVANERPRA